MLKFSNYLPRMLLIGANEDPAIANDRGLVFRNVPDVVAVGSGVSYVYRFNVAIKTKLLSRILTAISGHIKYEIVVGATETAPGTPVTLACTNNEKATTPLNTMSKGVTITGGSVIDTVELITGQGGNSASLPDAQAGGRTLAEGQTFWLRITGIGSSSSAVLNLLLYEYQ